MITIIFAPPRTGKTALLTYLSNEAMFDYERNKAMRYEIMQKQTNGFEKLTIPKHCVSSNYDIIGHKFGYTERHSNRINPYRIGFANPYVKTHFITPYAFVAITEAQKYLNSRMSMYYPDWQSRWYEQHGHNFIDVFLDTQRPMLIDVNIRELANFIEILKLEKKYNKNGEIVKMIWKIRKIDNSSAFDKYMQSGKTEKNCYVEDEIVADYNVFELYDSRSCKPKFYQGHFDDDFDINPAEVVEQSAKGYFKWLRQNDDELPENFYRKICVPERHEDGCIHFHMLVGGLSASQMGLVNSGKVCCHWVDKKFNGICLKEYFEKTKSLHTLKETDGEPIYNATSFAYGYTTVSRIVSRERCKTYVKKYIDKDIGSTEIFKKRFYYSHNLNVPFVVKRLVEADFDTPKKIDSLESIKESPYVQNANSNPYMSDYNVMQIWIDNQTKSMIDKGLVPIKDDIDINDIF